MAKSNRNLRNDEFDASQLQGKPSDIGTLGVQQSRVPLFIFGAMLLVAVIGPLFGGS